MNIKALQVMADLIVNFNKMGLHKDAGEMINLLNDLIDAHTEDEESETCSTAISGNGLRENGTVENLNQGFSVEPIYFR